MKRLAAIIALCLAATIAHAQQGTTAAIGAVPITINPTAVTAGTYVCPSSITVSPTGQITAIATGACGGGTGSSITVTGGPGVAVSGCPACIITTTYPAVTKTAGYAFASTDTTHLFVYNSTAAGTFTLPAVTTTGFGNGWGICVAVRGTGALTLATAAPSVFWGGPTTLGHDQSECIQGDDTGNWALFTGVSPVAINPNAFQ